MLHNLKILNGEMTPEFDEANSIYTVAVTNDVASLKLIYTIDEEANVTIIGNDNLSEGENTVLIEVSNAEEKLVTYTLKVNKEKTEAASSLTPAIEKIDVPKELPNYVAPLIAIICFTLILLMFRLIFIRRKHKK